MKIKAPGMADMPGESQEEPSVMVVAIRCVDPLTSLAEMFSERFQVVRLSSRARNAMLLPHHQLPTQPSC
jgi:hypothetical protein